MKLVLIADTFPPLRTSGAVQLRDLTRELLRLGHEVCVLLPDASLNEGCKVEQFEKATIVRLKSLPTKDVGYIRRAFSELLMPYAMRWRLRRSPLRDLRWDGVVWYSPSIFHGPLVRSIKRRSGCRGYLIVRDIFPEWAADLGLMRRGIIFSLFRLIARRQYQVADFIGVQSPGNLSYFSNWANANRRRSLEVLPNWLGPQGADPCVIRLEKTVIAGRRILVYAGNIGVAQGIDIFIDLAQRMKDRDDIGFLFVGRGSEVARIVDRQREEGLDNVVICDEVDPDQIPDLLAQCDIGLVALDRRHKSHNIPGKFLTYMQCGLPVLASLNPENDLLRVIQLEGVGAASDSGDVGLLKAECEKLIAQIDQDEDFSKKCKALFTREFSASNAASQIVAALRRSIHHDGDPR